MKSLLEISPLSNPDIVVVGTGPAGLACALALKSARWNVALVGRPPAAQGLQSYLQPVDEQTDYDPRVYALTPQTQQFLNHLGVWPLLAAKRCAPMFDIAVYQGDLALPIRFESASAHMDRLASIVEHGHLLAALETGVKVAGIPHYDAKVTALAPATAQALRLQLDDGQVLETKLLVGADGARSVVRELSGIKTRQKDYQQRALVTNFRTQIEHGGVARQWFLPDGIIALLPMPDPFVVNLVWSLPTARAAYLEGAADGQLTRELEQAIVGYFGNMQQISPLQQQDLIQLRAQAQIAERVALVGDAAHVIHPMAGHGLNLGFGDAQALARVLNDRDQRTDPGARQILRQFERGRAEAVASMSWITDGLYRAYFDAPKAIAPLRNLGWHLVASQNGLGQWLRNKMIAQASLN